MTPPADLVRQIEEHGGQVRIRDGELRLARSRNVPPKLIEQAKIHRDQLFEHLRGLEAADVPVGSGRFCPISPDSGRLDPSGDIKHGDAPKPVANGHQWPGITYTADMGEIHLERRTSVMIAGRVRLNIVWLYPGLVRHYEFADLSCPNGYGT